MRILYLTSGFPYPLTAGHLRYYHFMRELSRRHSVSLLSLTNETFTAGHQQALAAFLDRVLTFPRHDEVARFGRFLKEDVRLMFGVEPAMAHLREAARAEVAAERCDVVVMAGKRVLPAARPLTGVPVVADVCDAESLRFRGRMQVTARRERLRAWLGYQGLRALERRVVRRADLMLFASPRDRDALVAASDPRAAILPNGVDTTYWRRTSKQPGRNTIVFTGAMHYRPNIDAALQLIREIFPHVRRVQRDARLLIVGRDPSAALRTAAREPGVTVTGTVDDVRPYLEQATVYAGPLRYASGIQNKILEAMAMEIPVITSPVAAQGLWTAEGEVPPVEIAKDAHDFTERILQRLQRAAPSPVSVSRQFVERHFSWQRHGERLEKMLSESVQRFREAGPAASP